MKPKTTLRRLSLLTLCALLFVAPAGAIDRTNIINEKTLRTAPVKRSVDDALKIYRNGGFRGFQPAPGCSIIGTDPIYDFIVQDIAIDAYGNPTNQTPLTAARTRNFKVGDTLPYIMHNHPLPGENPKLPGHRMRRYAVPYPSGYDQDKKPYPIVAGIRDMTPELRSSEYNTLGVRDLVSMVGIFPDYACYMGAYIPRKGSCVISIGAGYANPAVKGMARLAHPLFPNPVPKTGNRWYATVLQKTIAVGEDEETFKNYPDTKANTLAVQFVIGKRLPHIYGNHSKTTKPLDTIIGALGYNNVNTRGTAPIVNNPSSGVEIIYVTKEFGYATRWEMWHTENPGEDVIGKARKVYASQHLSRPASFEGKYTEHFEIGPLVEDKKLGLYKYDQTITDPDSGKKEIRTWYLVGGHDYTNLKPAIPPINPYEAFHPAKLNPYYLRFYGIPIALPKK